MLRLPNGCLLVQNVSELPDVPECNVLFMDFETRSGNPKRGGDSVWHGDRIAGIAVTWDDNPIAYYIPIRHRDESWNLPIEPVRRWLKLTMSKCKRWANHNVLFDAHFAAEGDDCEFISELFDTLTMAKFIDSDRIEYGLKELYRDWCGGENSDVDRMKAYLDGIKSKDYADCPADIMGEYATGDVIKNRHIYRIIISKYDESMKLSFNNEILLTPVLYDIEKYGMPVDVQELKVEKAKSLHKQIIFGDRLHAILEHEINPNSHDQMYDVLINQFGLPVLAVNEDEGSNSFGNPTFNKDAMALYMVHPSVTSDPKKWEAVKLLKAFRDEIHFMGLFLDPYLELNVNGILHPSYNQCVRTGRMSCRNPNAQQLNRRAKKLIRCRKGRAIISADYSQIEFRGIAHFIEDAEAIKSYNENPLTDFHQWVADMCGVKRKAAKCLNFGMGFGAGKAKVKKMLSSNPEVMDEVSAEINAAVERGEISAEARNSEYSRRCESKAEALYNTYHERLPGIKRTSRMASDIVKRRGYVFNPYGRRRYLAARFCYKGFNSVVQSFAADVMKDTTVKLAPRYNKVTRDYGYNIFAIVHDDESGDVPIEVLHDRGFQDHLRNTLEDPSKKISIPIVTDMGFSLRDWAEASAEKAVYADGIHVAGPIEK